MGLLLTKAQVAQIIPLPAVDSKVRALNAAIPAWAASKNLTGSPVWVVDQWTNFTSADLYDGIHPSASGDLKMADRFYPALVRAIHDVQPPPGSPNPADGF